MFFKWKLMYFAKKYIKKVLYFFCKLRVYTRNDIDYLEVSEGRLSNISSIFDDDQDIEIIIF